MPRLRRIVDWCMGSRPLGLVFGIATAFLVVTALLSEAIRAITDQPILALLAIGTIAITAGGLFHHAVDSILTQLEADTEAGP